MAALSEWAWIESLNGWVVAAWVVETGLYASTASAGLRTALGRLPRWATALALTVSASLSYLLYAPATGLFEWKAFATLMVLAAALAGWYALLRPGGWRDAGFLLLVAGVMLARAFKRIYPGLSEGPPMEVLGQLMWIRLGVLGAVVLRRAEGVGFGWWPSKREWRIGALHFAAFLPLGIVLGLVTGVVRGIELPGPAWKVAILAAANFAGMMWVVALSEEFFFRGLLQCWASQWLRSAVWGWLVASLAFGAAHLPFRGFPNWRFALVATVAGLVYGRAYRAGQGIRAAMVAHALTNTVWRTLFG
ncbi:MAG: CPBP family intramembrane glutamic endopeptidase [Bryobacterales bacterium]|nr:CPBP family intramembrane metalloprotease [Bryobacteraceae bacterium]MDW8130076.1 CPBP family intramembrane glutamic endopeptidase [Bryobacterales bacterium]